MSTLMQSPVERIADAIDHGQRDGHSCLSIAKDSMLAIRHDLSESLARHGQLVMPNRKEREDFADAVLTDLFKGF